ncbi:MAG TPA: hypothetical protein VKZ63_18110 [Kofleriaceae bacterium]|nr:hypothetical protein [Kofleriaceae bacterium]
MRASLWGEPAGAPSLIKLGARNDLMHTRVRGAPRRRLRSGAAAQQLRAMLEDDTVDACVSL